MKLLIVSETGYSMVKDADFVPRVGDQIDAFYKPWPKVTGVLLWPNAETQKEMLGIEGTAIDAVVTVK